MKLFLPIFLVVSLCLGSCILASAMSKVNDLLPSHLRCDYSNNPLGLDTQHPRFSWFLTSTRRGEMQTAYQVLVASSLEKLTKDNGNKWNSGKVNSMQSVNVVYLGGMLSSGEKCWWKVRCWDKDGKAGSFSEPATFEMGLLSAEAWKGKWIGMDHSNLKVNGVDIPSPLLRKEIQVTGKVKRARVYISGLGWNEFYINGQKVSDNVLSPGLTDYNQEVSYCTYDVTALLKQGSNAISMMLGNGWFSSSSIADQYIDWERDNGGSPPKAWADRPQAIMQMTVTYDDGSEKHFYTDETWKASGGPIVSNHKRPGECYDARLEKPQWNRVGYDDSQWRYAEVIPAPKGRLTSQTIPPMKVQSTLRPIKLTNNGNGAWVFEFDRFFGGWVRLSVKGKAGTKITLNYEKSEKDIYTLKGTANGEVYEPRFTFHPVRYVRVEGLEKEPDINMLEGREVYSDVDLYGSFACSNELLNQIHGNIQRSLKVGLKGFILDCLHREPIAYNEPASIFGSLSTRKFMPDLWKGFAHSIQLTGSENGDLSDVVPRLNGMKRASDVSQNASYPMLIWYLYECYGDERLLEQHFQSVKAWVDFIGRDLADSTHIVRKGWLGEHMLPGGKPGEESFISKETPKDFIWTCLYYQNVRVLANMCRVLGKKNDEGSYMALAESIRATINREWLNTKTGHYASASQTSDILPLAIGLVPPENQQQLIRNIATTISENSNKFKVGHVGLPGFMESLVNNGLGEVVYKAVNTTEYPGWGYMISKGATTVWENWGHISEESMTMLTGVCRFFYEGIAGIQEPQFFGDRAFAPGYSQIIIKPHVLGDLSNANASIKTVRGILSSSWKKSDNSLTLKVSIPINATASVSVPVMKQQNPTITEGGKIVWKDGTYVKGVEGISGGKQDGAYVTINVGSGIYEFESN